MAERTTTKAPQKFYFECPLCGSAKADAGRYIGCWSCESGGLRGGDYLRALAKAVGAPGGGALLDDPWRWLSPLAHGRGRHRRTAAEPEPLPSSASIAEWRSRLLRSRKPLHYLLVKRGLSVRTIRKYSLGWDGDAFTLPVYDVNSRELVNVRRRAWPAPFPNGSKYMGLRGRNRANRGVQLYPSVPEPRWLLLCAGEFDALLCRQHGLPAISGTIGTAWSRDWDAHVADRRLVVIYDVGEEPQARSRALDLRSRGIAARYVSLRRAGLRHGEDLTSWFVKYGRTADELRELMRSTRPRREKRRP